MSGFGGRRNTEQQSLYVRQATILRKNLGEWDLILRNPKGEDWSRMLGRLNAAYNQTTNMDKSIDDVMEHFVYLPKQCTANPQDIPFFLSTRLETTGTESGGSSSGGGSGGTSSSTKKEDKESSSSSSSSSGGGGGDGFVVQGDPVRALSNYENNAADLAQKYEEEMVRF